MLRSGPQLKLIGYVHLDGHVPLSLLVRQRSEITIDEDQSLSLQQAKQKENCTI